jgi:ATP-dependent exoDNAse (exonuclease V) alpha subunit
MLSKLPTKPKEFVMLERGNQKLVEVLKKGCLSPEKLILKEGAAIMFTKNNVKAGYVNGTLGTVEYFQPDSGLPVVITRTGERVVVEQAEWTLQDGGRVLAQVNQIPLRLAWAITVHKSQGMSMDEAVMDLSQVFEYGQGYVALSRVRQLKGVHLLGWNERAFMVHPEVLVKDQDFRSASDAAALAFKKLKQPELNKMFANFIRASGGIPDAEPEKKERKRKVRHL